ncbi:endonuclease/exonuclease/phosphatase family protein [uncultured Gimesia sp.]|uniref:endonuclease/exonuclease/phosphatase family protein n=1 Tax=uncultured Gimesia sp. TaxID=1678688 RepID=UPI0030DCFC91|tara:strand:+ start:23229 stop:24659 length:1431 start_codon:yes stop_codon:yes gene_type:complete
MANSLKLLSWNIQKFGEQKLNDNAFIEYVALVIYKSKADVVGLMELVGWQGNEIRDALVTKLNNLEALNKTGITWAGEASEMTPSLPNEQYLYLWKKGLFSRGQIDLWNVIGESAFSDYFAKYSSTPQQEEDFWKSLYSNGWLNADYTVPWGKWFSLKFNDQNLDLTKKAPQINLTPVQKTEIVAVLTKWVPEAFPTRGSRPPFLLSVKTTTTPTEIVFMLFHAPGPGNALPIIASNTLTFVEPIQTTGVGVVMGDFNVDSNDAGKKWHLEYFDKDKGRRQYVKDTAGNFIPAAPFQRLTGPAFATQASDKTLTKVEGYEKRLWDSKTSTVANFPGATNVVADDVTVAALRSSEYDKFFVRAPQPDPNLPKVIPLIDMMVPKDVQIGVQPDGTPIMETRSTTKTPYDDELSGCAQLIYNNWWTRQNNKANKSATTQKKLKDCPQLNTSPSCLHEAYYVYREAISDHFPIFMELQYA